MTKYIRNCVLIFMFSFFMSCENDEFSRELFTLNTEWKFAKGTQNEPTSIDFDDRSWESIRVPHDWAISGPFIITGDGNTGKLPWKDEGWYRKELNIPSNYQNKRVVLIFDGVMAFPKIYVNGVLAGTWDYGYNSFYVDITDHLNFGGENMLAVHADTREHDSRWYPGGGIYRKVQMLVTNPIHVNVWGTQITTPIVQKDLAEIKIRTSISNETDKEEFIKVEHIIYNSSGQEHTREHNESTILAEQKMEVDVLCKVTDPIFWDTDQPEIYSVTTNVYKKGKLIDTYDSSFGIRTIQFTADDGFHLNGKRIQLKGVNLHSDFGPLGMAFNTRAMERQLEIMKSMGVNAIRNSHNIAAPELLDLCDKMGLLFFNEIFDKYDGKADITDTTDFEEFTARNIKNFIVRDRNHPSIFLWSVGNEIGDVQWNINDGFKKLQTMIKYVTIYDPTRPTTLVCDNLESATLRHFDYYDVHAWNYGRRYRLARELEPNKSVIISESASTLSTRGFYELPLPELKTDFTRSLQVSSYDLNAPWWAEVADDDFMWQQDEPYIAGEFVWTGFDYLGEPTPYNNKFVEELGMTSKEASRSSYFGIVDLVGIPKDRFYLYKSYWKPDETTIHILPHWNWEDKEGENVPVFVYTNGDCAELFINGKSQEKRCKDPTSKNSIERFRLMWNDVIYEKGEVKAVAFKNGIQIGEKIISTAGTPYALKLTPDRKELKANGEDLSYVLVEAIDKDGNLCPLAKHTIKLSLTGKAQIEGVGNGNPQSFAPFQSDQVDLFYGKAMIIVRSEVEKSKVQIVAKASGLKDDSVDITIN